MGRQNRASIHRAAARRRRPRVSPCGNSSPDPRAPCAQGLPPASCGGHPPGRRRGAFRACGQTPCPVHGTARRSSPLQGTFQVSRAIRAAFPARCVCRETSDKNPRCQIGFQRFDRFVHFLFGIFFHFGNIHETPSCKIFSKKPLGTGIISVLFQIWTSVPSSSPRRTLFKAPCLRIENILIGNF